MRAPPVLLFALLLAGCSTTEVVHRTWNPYTAARLDRDAKHVVWTASALTGYDARGVVKLAEANADGITVLDLQRDSLRFSPDRIRQITVVLPSRKGRGVGLGAVCGAAIGAFIAYSTAPDQCGGCGALSMCWCIEKPGAAVLGGIAGTIPGMILGALAAPGRRTTIYRFGYWGAVAAHPAGLSLAVPIGR